MISPDFITLLDLQSKLKYYKYKDLNLHYLEHLQLEVDEKVERRCQVARERRTSKREQTFP